MRINLTPISILTAAVLFGLTCATIIILLAIAQPYMGIKLEPAENGLTVINAYGPSSSIPENSVIESIENSSNQIILRGTDLTIEPDGAIKYYSDYRDFLKTQGRIYEIISSDQFTLTTVNGNHYTIRPESSRPILDLPVKFWVQLVVGLVAWFISAAVFAFRTKEKSAQYLLLSGLATLIFAPFAAVYSTRELAMPETLFMWLSDGNFFGGSLFTASFVALLLHYPRRIAPNWVGPVIVSIYVIWFILQQMDVFESMTFARRFLVMISVFTSFALAGFHWFKTKNDPVARAALQWFLLSWMLGTILFWFFVLMPQMFGVNTAKIQGYAFLLFILVYGGLAFGILRYRLFDLGRWWGAVVIWAITILILVLFDLLFLLILQFSMELSISLALLISGLLWIPVRSYFWSKYLNRTDIKRDDLFERVVNIGLTAPPNALSEKWQQLLKDVFNPLNIDETVGVEKESICNDGLSLTVPPVYPIPALELNYAHAGRKLFTTQDKNLARELVSMLRHTIESKSSYEKGMQEERARISRDMHDNIGSQLLGALHNQNTEHKDTIIRETLSDLRDIINNASRIDQTLDDMLANLRVESIERLQDAGIKHNWMIKSDNKSPISQQIIHTLKSIIREAVSNIIKHSKAQTATIKIHQSTEALNLVIRDDGKGVNFNHLYEGNGLSNMKTRAVNVGGNISYENDDNGLVIAVTIPIRNKDHGT